MISLGGVGVFWLATMSKVIKREICAWRVQQPVRRQGGSPRDKSAALYRCPSERHDCVSARQHDDVRRVRARTVAVCENGRLENRRLHGAYLSPNPAYRELCVKCGLEMLKRRREIAAHGVFFGLVARARGCSMSVSEPQRARETDTRRTELIN